MPSLPTMMFLLLDAIQSAAKSGQLLPQLTVLLILQIIIEVIPLLVSQIATSSLTPYTRSRVRDAGYDAFEPYLNKLHIIHLYLLGINILLNMIGYILLYKLYHHSITTIFNRKVPSSTQQSIPSFALHLSMLKPLEIVWRLLTYRLR